MHLSAADVLASSIAVAARRTDASRQVREALTVIGRRPGTEVARKITEDSVTLRFVSASGLCLAASAKVNADGTVTVGMMLENGAAETRLVVCQSDVYAAATASYRDVASRV